MMDISNTNDSIVRLSLYDPEWKTHYCLIEKQLIELLAGLVESIEHIGSTAIPGMRAKNVIDIQCGVMDFNNIEAMAEILAQLGFQYVAQFTHDHVPFEDSDYQDDQWEKRFFKGSCQGIVCNLHVRIVNHDNWNFALTFRDFLRKNKKVAIAYEQVKSRLEEQGLSHQAYAHIKDPVCDLIYWMFTEEQCR